MPPLRPWRSPRELSLRQAGDSPAPGPEFPLHAPFLGEIGRRSFLALAAGTLALAGLGGCASPPPEEILPYVNAPPEIVPGRSLHYATTLSLAGYGRGAVVESVTGRPIHVEGNPGHPSSGGAVDVFMQASLMDLYAPDRQQAITEVAQVRSAEELQAALRSALPADGRGVRLLTGTVTSPSLLAALRRFLERHPEARWHRWEPTARSSRGERLAFGRPAQVVLRPGRARVLLSLDEDFLFAHPDAIRHARELADRRQPEEGRMARLYCAEASSGLTGANADVRWAMAPWDLERFAWALGARLGVGGGSPEPSAGVPPDLFEALARDLESHPGESLVAAGPGLAPETVALVHALNQRLGNVGRTVEYLEPVDPHPDDPVDSLLGLGRELEAGAVETLLILGGNPVYTAPADLPLGEWLGRARQSFQLALRPDETSPAVRWVVPAAHELESWGDLRSWEGVPSPVQPLIRPLTGGLTALELLSRLSGDLREGLDLVRSTWAGRLPREGWTSALREGIFPGSPPSPLGLAARRPDRPVEVAPQGRALVFRPDPCAWDGAFTPNPWLLELPRPLTRISWDNAALVGPRLARELGLEDGDMVRLQVPGAALEAPVFVLPGHPPECVTVHLGYGRRDGGLAEGVGFDAYRARGAASPWWRGGLEIAPLGRRHELVSVQEHFGMGGQETVVSGTLEGFLEDPGLGHEEPELRSLYPVRPEQPEHAWGMAIDLTRCLGCNACAVACQSENNIPVVGKDQVARGREMHWLHVDRYFVGDLEDPEVLFQPRPCMHCENAPCEPVCPVEATVHSSDGLNQMIYNRCVGTRYCSNNCPYKVRRFNFLDYTGGGPELGKMQRNPEVTVRSRGVMEKCTYCVQRIQSARIEAEKEERAVRDGEIRTACQQACPTRAIVFGDLLDPESEVRRALDTGRAYGLLAELNTRPRTRYLGRVKNPAGPT